MRKMLMVPVAGLFALAPQMVSAQVYPPAVDSTPTVPSGRVPGAPVVTPGGETPLRGVQGSVTVDAQASQVVVEISNLDPDTPVQVVARISQSRSVTVPVPVADMTPAQAATVLASAPYEVDNVRPVTGSFSADPGVLPPAAGQQVFPAPYSSSPYVAGSSTFKAFDFSFDGRLPGSPFSLWVQSDPLLMVRGEVDSNGAAAGVAYLPGALPAGEHRFSVVSDVVLATLDASSGAVSGEVLLTDEQKALLGDCGAYSITINATTQDGDAVSNTVNVGEGCPTSGGSTQGPGVLPSTGSNSSPLGLWAAVLVVTGGFGVFFARRSKARSEA